MVKWDGPGRSADHHNQAIRILGQSGFRDKRGAKVACPCYVVVMLDHSTIRKIVHEAVQAHAPPQGVRDVLSEPDTDIDGSDGLRITVVLTPEAVEALRRGTVGAAIVAVQHGLRDAGEERFPVVWWSTEAELEAIDEPES